MTLSDLTPEGVRDEVLELVRAHFARLSGPLDRLTVEQLLLAYSALRLAEYAQSGRDDETDNPQLAAETARSRILSIATTLGSSPWRSFWPDSGPVCGPTAPPESWPTTGIGLACLAAWARIRLAAADALTARELAALGGLTGPANVRVMISRGEIARDEKGEITATEARRWLSGRGVAGV